MAKSILPRVHVLVICDEIEERREDDPVHDLLGVRTQMTAPMFPHVCPQLCVYAQVTAHARTAVCQAVVIRTENDEEVAWTTEEEVPFFGPSDFIPLRFWLVDCRFPVAGVYYVQIYFDGKLCGERAFEVIESGGDADG